MPTNADVIGADRSAWLRKAKAGRLGADE